MKYITVATIIAFMMKNVSASEVGGEQKTITLSRCNKGLKLYNAKYGKDWGKCTSRDGDTYIPCAEDTTFDYAHDIYGEGQLYYESDIAGQSAWMEMVKKFPGIDGACEKFNTALNDIANDFIKPPSADNQYVSNAHSWRRAITKKLHDVGCAISPNDDNLETFVESFNYPHQQRIRMAKASRAADEYELVIGGLQDDWRVARMKLVADMKAHGDVMTSQIHKSKKDAAEGNYPSATDALLGDQEGSARYEVSKIRGTLSGHARTFEQVAQKLKRDSLRWSKLTQIKNEQERLTQMTEVVRMNSFDILTSCLTNYQKEYTWDWFQIVLEISHKLPNRTMIQIN